MKHQTKLLDNIKYPKDLKNLSDNELKTLCKELRNEVIDAVSVTGGHLGAGLGVVELTVAIHSVFNTPKDKLIWDVGHQCYPHKHQCQHAYHPHKYHELDPWVQHE